MLYHTNAMPIREINRELGIGRARNDFFHSIFIFPAGHFGLEWYECIR